MRVDTHALGIPWAITQEGLEVVLAIATRGEAFAESLQRRREQLRLDAGGEPRPRPQFEQRGEVAIVPVYGTLMRKAELFDDISGATSYESIRKQLRAALDERTCRAILLKVDSPGGEAAGCGELAAEIREYSKSKPILTYVEALGCSAAYYLGAAADQVLCAPASFLGSIGVRSGIRDDSKVDERLGIRRIEIVSSQSPAKRGSPVDDAVIARVQQRVDDLCDLFVADVAKFRGVTADKVLEDFGQGDHMIAARAVKAGLADKITTFEDALVEARRMGAKAPRMTAGTPPARRLVMKTQGTLAARLTALAALDGLSADIRTEVAELAAVAHEQAAELGKLKSELVNVTQKADRADYEELIRQAKANDDGEHARKITSPAQEAKIRELFSSAPELKRHLEASASAPKLNAPRPAAEGSASEQGRREFLLNNRGYAGGGAQ